MVSCTKFGKPVPGLISDHGNHAGTCLLMVAQNGLDYSSQMQPCMPVSTVGSAFILSFFSEFSHY